MAFVTTYSLTWIDVNSVDWVINFQEDGASGFVKALTPGATPAKLSWNGGDKYQPIVGSSLEIQMVYESAVDDLFTDQSQYIKVSLLRDSDVKWEGFISPGQYYRQLSQPKTYATITATDGMGELKNIKFEDGSGDPYWGQETEIVVIANILLKTGIAEDIYEFINIYDANHDTADSDSPLAQTYIYQEAYWDEQTDERSDCYTVLSDILTKYGATIRRGVAWLIIRPNSYALESIDYRQFDSDGVYESEGSSTIGELATLGSDTFYVHADQELRKLMGVGKCEVTLNPPRRDNLLKNGSFDEFTWTGSAFDYWSVSGTPAYAHSVNQLLMRSNDDTTSPTEYIYTTVDFYKAKSININFDYKAIYTGTPTYKSIIFQIREDYTGQYLTTAGWVGSTNYYTFAPTATNTDYSMSIDVPEVITGGFDVKTRLIFRIYEFFNENAASGNYVLFDNFRIDVDYAVPGTKLHSYDNTITINNVKSMEIALGDSWNTEVAPGASFDDSYYVNTFDATSDDLTTVWSISGDPTAAAPIAELLARQMVEGFRRSIDELSGTIRSALWPWGTICVRDPNITDEYGFVKSFFPTNVTYDTRRNEVNGTWVECPVTYTEADLGWASSDYDTYSIDPMTPTVLLVEDSNPDGTATFEDYSSIASETVRVVLDLVDNGAAGSVLPPFAIEGNSKTVAWGRNSYTYTAGVATDITCIIGGGDLNPGEKHDYTATLTIYGITGI